MFVIRTFIRVLESSPTANVIDQDGLKCGSSGLHIVHESLQSVAPVNFQPATTGIFENPHDFKAALLGVSPDRVELIFG